MSWLALAVLFLVLFASALALAEASISRMTLVRAMALREEGRRNAGLLEEIESDPARYLNAVYLSVMLAQNGSAILVAIIADRLFGALGTTVASVGFTLAYFVVVEAMSKTFAILHSDRVALDLSPLVWLLGRVLALPTRGLIGLANVLLPGKGLAQGPFVTERDIRTMADIGHEQGVIEEEEKKMIHSLFHFGDTPVGRVMVPRPDVVAIDLRGTVRDAEEAMVRHGFTRLPAHRGDLDQSEGIVHVKDVLRAIHEGRPEAPLGELLRPVRFVPESKRLSALLSEMRQEQFHLALVVDEYGSVAGLVTLEDLLEELVGEIADEHDAEERDVEPLGDGRYRVEASVAIEELNELLGTDLPHERWNTVGGLMFGLLGAIPSEGEAVSLQGFRFTAERVQGRRVKTVLVTREAASQAAPA